MPTLPPFSSAPEYKSKTFILDMPLSRSVCIYSKRDVIYTIDRMAFHKTNTHDLQLWNAKLTETRIFRELSIEIESSLIELKGSLIQLESS